MLSASFTVVEIGRGTGGLAWVAMRGPTRSSRQGVSSLRTLLDSLGSTRSCRSHTSASSDSSGALARIDVGRWEVSGV